MFEKLKAWFSFGYACRKGLCPWDKTTTPLRRPHGSCFSGCIYRGVLVDKLRREDYTNEPMTLRIENVLRPKVGKIVLQFIDGSPHRQYAKMKDTIIKKLWTLIGMLSR